MGSGIAFIVSATVPPHRGAIPAASWNHCGATPEAHTQTPATIREFAIPNPARSIGASGVGADRDSPTGFHLSSLSDRPRATHCPVGFPAPPLLPGATGRSETMFGSRRVVSSFACISPQGRDGTALLSPAAASVLPRALGRGVSFGWAA